jgi:hypothetical protein
VEVAHVGLVPIIALERGGSWITARDNSVPDVDCKASSVFPEVVGQFGLDEERSGARADRSVRPLNNTILGSVREVPSTRVRCRLVHRSAGRCVGKVARRALAWKEGKRQSDLFGGPSATRSDESQIEALNFNVWVIRGSIQAGYSNTSPPALDARTWRPMSARSS